jgi:uncharacterized pyridoxal phosphate-containing UPF0001 family protein
MSGPGEDAAALERLTAELRARHRDLRARIAAVTDRDVRVVCVTKGHPPLVARAALRAGLVDLGENYAQELTAKAAQVHGADGGPAPRWHAIGRLQRNKVRQLADVVSLWHTVDRPELAEEIARRRPGAAVLVQLDLAGLPGRGGCEPADAPDLVRRCTELGLVVEGLMGVGTPGPPESARPGFARLRTLADQLELPTRCMGMSGDLEVALEEGATMVRVGTALVGPRPAR